MSNSFDAFDGCYLAEFSDPFDSIEGVAAYLMHPDNDAPVYTAIRSVVHRFVVMQTTPYWDGNLVEMITKIPETRMLMVDCESLPDKWRLARRILDEAYVQAGGDDIEEEGR